MAALSSEHNKHLSDICPTPSFSSDLSNATIHVPANSRLSSTNTHFSRELSRPPEPSCQHIKVDSRAEKLTSQILEHIFNVSRFPSRNFSRPSHLQLLRKSRKLLLSAVQLNKLNFAKPSTVFRMRRKEPASTSASCSKFGMAPCHSIVACTAVSSRPTTVVATSYDVDGQLRSNVISGRKSKYTVGFPDEGVFLIYRNRALQIATPPCDQRKCSISQVCRCHDPNFSTQGALLHRHASKKRTLGWPTRKPCSHCLFNWLHLYQAMDAASKLNMKCLQYPRSLTLTVLHGQEAFYYDGEIEDQDIHSKCNGDAGKSTNPKSSCSPKVFEWMTDGWNEFMNCCCCKTATITALSDCESDMSSEDRSSSSRRNSDTDWDWDDLDIPSKQTNTSSVSDFEDYDFIEDLVDEEFPKLRRSGSAHVNVAPQSKPEPYNPSMNSDDSDEEDDDPAPIIIPPKGMAIGQGLHIIANPTSPTLVPAGNDSSVTVTDPGYAKSQVSLGTKRSYFEHVQSEQSDEESFEDLSRVKQRKLDRSTPEYGSRCQQGFIVDEPFPQNNHLQKLIPA